MSCEEGDDGFVAKLRGLPWSATPEEILEFFGDCKIVGGKSGIHMTTSRDGRPSGEAFIELEDAEDLEIAVSKDREHMGNRYIEVFKVNKAEMEWVIKRSGPGQGSNDDGCVRLRGLPFGCSKEEIAQFFTGLEIVPNGITLLTDYSGRSSGEAYVQFVNREVAEKALQKHREKIGHRYIEIFRSNLMEVSSNGGYQPGFGGARRGGGGGGVGGGSGMYNSRPSPYDRDGRFGNGGRFGSTRGARSYKDYNSYDRSNQWSNNRNSGDAGPRNWDSWSGGVGGGSGGGNDRNSSGGGSGGGANMHCVHMRGLPFKASEDDIIAFFKPIFPVNVRLLQDSSGRASGEADVEFSNHEDAVRAMSKDKGHMHHRYIELFLNSAGGSSTNGGISSYGTLGSRRRM